MTLRILLFGKNGQIGRELNPLLPQLGEVVALDRAQADFTKSASLREAIRAARPSIIVNAAAYTAVDDAESHEAVAHAVNADAPGVIAEEAKAIGAVLVHYSTDYVFDGNKKVPYVEDDDTNPLNAYGRTKLAGERAIRDAGVAHLIFRTSWVYSTRGQNFILKILRRATQQQELEVVVDQVGAPTLAQEIAAATTLVLSRCCRRDGPSREFSGISGTYHMTAAGETSWFHFAKAILEEASSALGTSWLSAAAGKQPLIARRVIPITTDESATRTRRPEYSVLSNARLTGTFGIHLSHWRTQLASVFENSAPL
jgi:dTDP-4-dehydrorhamnose reductase